MSIKEFANVPFIKNLAQELINSVGTYTSREIQYVDDRIYKRKNLQFRDIIDQNFPSLLIIDYTKIRQELKKFNDIARSATEVIGEEATKNVDFRKYKEKKLSDSEIDLIVGYIKEAIEYHLPQQTKVKKINYQDLQLELQFLTNDVETSSGQILNEIKKIFNSVIEVTGLAANNKYFLFPKFTSLDSILTPALNKAFPKDFFKDVGTLGEVLNYGHTSVGYKQGDTYKLQFNSPKLISIIFDVVNSSQQGQLPVVQATQAASKFITQTRQDSLFVEIEKDFSDGFISMFVSIGGNIITFENSLINQLKGSTIEKGATRLGENKVVLSKLAKEFSNSSSKIFTEVARTLLRGRGSPNVYDYILDSVIKTLEGKKPGKFKQKTNVVKKSTTKQKIPVISGFSNGQTKIAKKATVNLPSAKLTRNFQSLVSLQLLLNSRLLEQIKQNMGTGDRRDVLNYRTGRFAESVRVERLTQGREGMLSVYYNYMKYPYATFSDGGRQEYPKTRDPKLLISKSIREIAAQAAVTRLRAVLV